MDAPRYKQQNAQAHSDDNPEARAGKRTERFARPIERRSCGPAVLRQGFRRCRFERTAPCRWDSPGVRGPCARLARTTRLIFPVGRRSRSFPESTVLWASATALLGEEGRLSYSDLMVRAQNVAAVLRRKGMRPGDLVGVVGLRTFSSISGIVGVLLAGGVYVPFDVHGQSAEKLTRQRDESAIRLLVTDRSDAAGVWLPWARHVTLVDASRLEREFMPLFREVKLPQRLPEDPAAVVFNADGRGVLVTHAGIVRLVTGNADGVPFFGYRAAARRRTRAFVPDGAVGSAAGGRHGGAGTAERSSAAMPAHEYARVMRRYRVSAICARPALLEELAREPLAPLDQVQQAVVDAGELDAAIRGVIRDRMGTRERALRVSRWTGSRRDDELCGQRASERGAGRPDRAGGRQRRAWLCCRMGMRRSRGRWERSRSRAMRWPSAIWDSPKRRWRRLPRRGARTREAAMLSLGRAGDPTDGRKPADGPAAVAAAAAMKSNEAARRKRGGD